MTENLISLSVLVPVYNEQHLVAESLSRLKVLNGCDFLSWIEVVVDDGSTDRTEKVLADFAREQTSPPANSAGSKIRWSFHRQPQNLGKRGSDPHCPEHGEWRRERHS